MDKHEIPDIIVVGSGAGGMTAALTGSLLGLKVRILEKSGVIGGTTALSAGSVWIPNSIHSKPGADNKHRAKTYLRNTVGNRLKPELCDAFLENGPAMVKFLADTPMIFRAYPTHPDYLADSEGATLFGRALEPVPFDGTCLGNDFRMLRNPLPEFTIFGGMMVNREDISNLLSSRRNPFSLLRSLKLLGRYGLDRLRFHRGTRLVMGNALVGRLYLALKNQGLTVETDMHVIGITKEDQSVSGVTVKNKDTTLHVPAKLGVILASGGFSRHPELRKLLLPMPIPTFTPIPTAITGDGITLGLDAGGSLGNGHAENSFWTPVSIRKRDDGSTAVFPHFVLDRGKPGLIAVNKNGNRFVSEATDYHSFGKAMYTNKGKGAIPCYFICDTNFIRKYGLGMVYPGASNLSKALVDGYVVKEKTVSGLAQKLNVDSDNLLQEINAHNKYAETGNDKGFNKGGNNYERNLGDPSHGPNPCIGCIKTPPFYSIEVYPGDIGASVGLVTDANARVVAANNEPIPGLFACGNDMDSVMAGVYPGPGITIGPAMTFGYIAAKYISENRA